MPNNLAISPLTNGTTYLNKYVLKERIGSGSFGEVWLAHDMALSHEFALKILMPSASIDAKLIEARVGHKFSHNNLVRVHQADVTSDGMVLIAMDYFQKGSVTNLANCANFVPLNLALRATIDFLRGLEHLHIHNFYHNDIKPQNILLGDQGQAKLSDYGIVGSSKNGEAVAPSAWYKLHAAPEIGQGLGIEAKTDIFQAGLTFFRLLVGLGVLESKMCDLGEDGYEGAVANGKLVTKTDFPDYVPLALKSAILKSIDPNPAKRYQSALAMRRDLEKLSFFGSWTVDDAGDFVGEDSKYLYKFSCQALGAGNSSFECFKLSKSSDRQTKISKYRRKNVSKDVALATRTQFFRDVVLGKV
ncbi:serine/threonine-protein kinase [Agrobacterium tumefaciens]|uniref:serine/threonine-protein kinase n=1 Tax=Agrobacterium tumefaciens TaxID=358 RepID=UPI003BA16B57